MLWRPVCHNNLWPTSVSYPGCRCLRPGVAGAAGFNPAATLFLASLRGKEKAFEKSPSSYRNGRSRVGEADPAMRENHPGFPSYLCGLLPFDAPALAVYGLAWPGRPGLWGLGLEFRAAATLEKTFAIWPPIVPRMTSTTTKTRNKTSANAPTVRPIASPTPPPPERGAAPPAAGTHAWPSHRHRRSCE